MERKIGTLSAIILGLFLLGAQGDCGEDSSSKDRQSVNKQQKHYQVSQPLPRFDYSLERDVAIQLYQARNEKVTT